MANICVHRLVFYMRLAEGKMQTADLTCGLAFKGLRLVLGVG